MKRVKHFDRHTSWRYRSFCTESVWECIQARQTHHHDDIKMQRQTTTLERERAHFGRRSTDKVILVHTRLITRPCKHALTKRRQIRGMDQGGKKERSYEEGAFHVVRSWPFMPDKRLSKMPELDWELIQNNYSLG